MFIHIVHLTTQIWQLCQIISHRYTRQKQAWNMEVYHALCTLSYSNAAHINIKHSNFQAPKRQFCGNTSNTRLIPKWRGSEKWLYDESPSCGHEFGMIMVVSDGLRSTLVWSKFSQGSMPSDPLRTLHYTRKDHYNHAIEHFTINLSHFVLNLKGADLKEMKP